MLKVPETCSTHTFSIVISPPDIAPATSSVPATMRSGMIVNVTSRGAQPPTMRIVEVPAPSTRKPAASKKLCRSQISGSRAAFRITVSPLAETAAIMMFSVAPTLG